MALNSIPLVSPVPQDKAFVPRPDLTVTLPPVSDPPSAPQAIAFWEAKGQQLATDADCAVLLHYSAAPHFERTGATLRVTFIPADPNAQLPEIEPPV